MQRGACRQGSRRRGEGGEKGLKKLPYFCWYPADFDVDENVKLMNLEEIGLYAVCLNHSWVNGSLPADPLEIARAMKVPKSQFLRSWPRVAPCFMARDDGRWVNSRQESERELAKAKSEKGRESAGKRWGKDANASDSQCQPNARASDSDSVSGVGFSSEEKPKVSLAARIDGQPFFERLIGAFLASGVKLSEQRLRDAGFEWVSMPDSEWEPAAIYAETKARSTDARHMGWPANYLKKKDWMAIGPGRVMPLNQPTRFDQANAEAAEMLRKGRSF